MECLFCIWLARNNKDRTPSTANCNLNDPSKETCNSPSSLSSLKRTIKPVSNTKSTHPVGFISKGNMCYGNSVLQVLSVVPNLWNRVPSESNTLLPMLQAISLNMAVKKNSAGRVEPSNFLLALKRKLSIIRGVTFSFNTQQDVVGVLWVVLDELRGISMAAGHLICDTQKITVSCNTCFCSSGSEENLGIHHTKIHIHPTSFSWHPGFCEPVFKARDFDITEEMVLPSCNLLCESTRGACVVDSAPILTI